MKYIRIILFNLIFIFVVFLIVSFVNANEYIENYNYADDRVIISLSNEESRKLKSFSANDFPELSLKKVSDLTQTSIDVLKNRKNGEDYSNDGVSIDKFNQTLCLFLSNPGYDNVQRALKLISKRKEVIASSFDYFTEKFSTNPDDTYVSDQWAIDNINLRDAWDITTGSVANPVKVGIIDSGIDGTHPDLASNVDTALSADCTTDPITLINNPIDDDDHGTFVAGIIGARGYNGIGIAGVAWYSKLVSLKVSEQPFLSFDTSTISSVIRAIDYSTSNEISILNYSDGWYIRKTYDLIYNNPVKVVLSNYPGLMVCAAGNSNICLDQSDNKLFPASFELPNVIVVGASDMYDSKCSFSNYSSTLVDLFAPGILIYSTVRNGNYSCDFGTSFAAPYVTGVAVLIKSIRPQFTGEEIKKLILNNVDKNSNFSAYCSTGGRLNAYKSLRAATEQQTFFGDVNGDGYKDIIMSGKNSSGNRVLTTLLGTSNGNFTNENSFTSIKSFYYIDYAYCGDFNGDGRSDILIHWQSGNYRQLYVYLGKTDGTFNEGVNLSSSRYHNSYQFPAKYLVMDVNNDGKDDFIVVYKNFSGKICFLNYSGSSSSPYIVDATTNALTSTYNYFDDSKIYHGDFNGDGYGDIIVPTYDSNERRKLTVFTGTGSGNFNEGQTLISTWYHRPYDKQYNYLVGDFNDDYHSDFLVSYDNNGFRDNITYLGNSITPYINDPSSACGSSPYSFSRNDYSFTGDVNGDGYDDLIIHYVNNNKRCLRVYNGSNNSLFINDNVTITTNNHIEYLYPCSIYAVDVNNDDKCDVIVKWKSGNICNFYVYKGKTDSTFYPAVSTTTNTYFYN